MSKTKKVLIEVFDFFLEGLVVVLLSLCGILLT